MPDVKILYAQHQLIHLNKGVLAACRTGLRIRSCAVEVHLLGQEQHRRDSTTGIARVAMDWRPCLCVAKVSQALAPKPATRILGKEGLGRVPG